jgi:hypothetical protein
MIGQFFESLRENTRPQTNALAAKILAQASISKCTRVVRHTQ